MQQFPPKLHLPYRDDSTISPDPFHDRDTSKVKAVWPVNKPKEKRKINLVNLSIFLFAMMVSMMCVYTLFIVIIALFKIFVKIVLGG